MAEKFNFTTKLHNCCASGKDAELRPWSIAIHFKDGYAYASEAHVMVKSSLEYHSVINPEFLDGKSIHKDNFKEILKFEIVECCEDGVSCKNSDGQVAFYEYMNMGDSKIPDFNKVLPDKTKLKDVAQIGLTPKYVDMCTSAMYSGSSVFRFKFTGSDTGILVDAIGFPNQIGLIMPNALSESIFEN